MLDETNPAVQDLELNQTLEDVFTIQAIGIDPGGIIDDALDVIIPDNGVCFLAGAKITTENGEIAIENVVEGQRVQTRDAGLQPVLWAGGQTFDKNQRQNNTSLWPVRIRAGTLGADAQLPDQFLTSNCLPVLDAHEAAVTLRSMRDYEKVF